MPISDIVLPLASLIYSVRSRKFVLAGPDEESKPSCVAWASHFTTLAKAQGPSSRGSFNALVFSKSVQAMGLRLVIAASICVGVLCSGNLFAEEPDASSEVYFERFIRPVLVEKCVGCHGPQKQWAELQLHNAAGLLKGGESGAVVQSGEPQSSELFLRIASDDSDYQMPPSGDATGPLTQQQIHQFEAWIRAGAKWPQMELLHEMEDPAAFRESSLSSHWAFQPVRNPAVPDEADVNGSNAEMDQNPIDAFVKLKLYEAGISQSPPASPRTLLRRLALDTTGLPPTLKDIQDFESSFGISGSAEVSQYEQRVDKYLNDKAFGEHWARLWLDVARFSDTKGYVYDREERFFVHSMHYRDWVINAFNADMPYDRFLELQLVADQLEPNNLEQLAAMGFLTLGKRFLGVVPDIIDDRIDTVTRGLLGLTVSCARCHDHKYDPISTAEYYGLFGIFHLNHEETVAGDFSDTCPSEVLEELAAKKNEFESFFESAKTEAEERLRKKISNYLMAQFELDKYPSLNFNQIVSKDDLYAAIVHRWQAYLYHANLNADPLFSVWNYLAKFSGEEFNAQAQNVAQALSQENAILPNGHPVHPQVQKLFLDPPEGMQEVADRYSELLNRVWNHKYPSAPSSDSEPTDNPDDSEKRDDADKIVVASKGAAKDEAIEISESRITTSPVESRAENETLSLDGVDSILDFLESVDSPCKFPTNHLSNIEWFLDTSTEDALWRKKSDYERAVNKHADLVPHYIVLRDNHSQLEPRVFRRGNPATKGDVVPRVVPEALGEAGKVTIRQGSGRRELAQAIVDRRNPLTARVWVNRVWQKYFGAGLVDSPSDFGLRAAPPSHPELLDWLAYHFMENGWSNRWLHRTILLSKTYQQSSMGPATSEQLEACLAVDPENKLLWRMNPKRKSFEVMRDSMLAASNELEKQFGGKSRTLFPSTDAENRRRSIYGLIDRQYMPGALSIFDVATPDMHTPVRNETTVPQQALFFLNHPFVAARARGLAHRLESEFKVSDGLNVETTDVDVMRTRERVQALFDYVLQRPATEEELQEICGWIHVQEATNEIGADAAGRASKDWSYGYGRYNSASQRLDQFHLLPYSNATHWQGGEQLPDAELGWVHVTAELIHSGNDKNHSAVRRWTSPVQGFVDVSSLAKHQVSQGDGARAIIVSSRHGELFSEVIFNQEKHFDATNLEVHPGDTIDFVVELHETLNHEDLHWAPTVRMSTTSSASTSEVNATESASAVEGGWDAKRDFSTGNETPPLTVWEQLAQVLLISNEYAFID